MLGSLSWFFRLMRELDLMYTTRLTPCVDENGIFASFRGLTISSIKVVEFSLKVSSMRNEYIDIGIFERRRTLSSYQVTI